ncbi:MAG TPA: tetratricopeptide repeat protein [Anaerolineales bacterium]|nr:tetratricopeptide repeat protein [Anaerolineales bacterium]
MSRTIPRTSVVLLLILIAILVPILVDGYSEIRKAAEAQSYPEMAEHYLRAAQRLPWRADLYELAGHAYFHERDFERADAMYLIAREKNALTPAGWAAWGDVNFLNGNTERAIEIWKQGLEQAEFLPGLYQRLAYAMQEQGEFSRAVAYFQAHLERDPDDAMARYRLGLLLILTDSTSAWVELLAASQLDPQFAPPAETLRSALSLASLNDSPSQQFVILGAGLGLVNEWQLARAAFESAVQADELNAEAWAWLGEANQHTGSEGSEALNRAFQLNPNSAVVRGLRGLYFERVGNYSQALVEHQAAASLDVENPERYFSLGNAYALNGDLIRALETYQYATSLAPDDANTWRMLAEFCGRLGIHLNDVGIPAAQRAVALDPNNSASEDTLGWLWYLYKDLGTAERHLLTAIDLDAQNASAHLHLGMVYLQANDRARAFDEFTLARDLGNEEADAYLKQFFP